MRTVPFNEALDLLPFLGDVTARTIVKPTEVALTTWDDPDFMALRPASLEDQTMHAGSEDWTLYSIGASGQVAPVALRTGRRIIYPARNMKPSGYNDFPDDVDVAGETVGDAIRRAVTTSIRYFVLLGRGRRRHFVGDPNDRIRGRGELGLGRPE
jgi:hypothetical protein